MSAWRDKFQAPVCIALLSLCLWGAISWPLPIHMAHGIASSAQNVEQPAWRYGMHGDHLQLLYYYELVRDMLAGRIPWFHNVYEFNLTGDEDRLQPGAYFFPFSLVYSFLAPFFGSALSWNLVQWGSVWLSGLFTWLWLRAFTQNRAALILGVCLVLCIPFRWFSLFHGSPTGSALMWGPALAWSIDRAIHRPTYTSGAWVGAILTLSYFTDLHVFFFSVYALPLFVAISLLGHSESRSMPWRAWYRVIPLGLLWAAILVGYHSWRKSYVSESVSAGARSWHEVSIYSPSAGDLFYAISAGAYHKTYLGFSFAVLFFLVVVFLAIRLVQGTHMERRRAALCLVVSFALLTILVLALGTNGPRNGLGMQLAREYIPYYAMIRQPAKIFAILIPLAGWLAAVGWSMNGRASGGRKFHDIAAFLLCGWLILDSTRAVSATIAMLPSGLHPAYESVASDAQTRDRAPGRVMVVPIWPGESAYTSYPMYLVQQANLRMINGYNPIVSRRYRSEIFLPLQSINMGWVTEDQLALLRSLQVDYIVVHEDMYPEKVSPFPVNSMLRLLDAHPNLEKLTQVESVHVYRIGERTADVGLIAERSSPALFPTRRWEAERLAQQGGVVVHQSDASGRAYWSAGFEDSGLTQWVETRPISVPPLTELTWMARVRGSAVIASATATNDLFHAIREIDVMSEQGWTWISIPIEDFSRYAKITLRLQVLQGQIDIDSLLLTSGAWPEVWPEEGIRFMASEFFRSGYTAEDGRAVHFRSDTDGGVVLYGPSLPMPPGSYTVDVSIASEQNDSAILGWLEATIGGETMTAPSPLVAGTNNLLAIEITRTLPFSLRLRSSRDADFTVNHITISTVH